MGGPHHELKAGDRRAVRREARTPACRCSLLAHHDALAVRSSFAFDDARLPRCEAAAVIGPRRLAFDATPCSSNFNCASDIRRPACRVFFVSERRGTSYTNCLFFAVLQAQI